MCLAEWTLALTEGMTHLCQVPGNTSSLSLNSLPCLAAVWKEKTVPTGGLGLDWEVPVPEIRDQAHTHSGAAVVRRRHSWDMPGLGCCYL